MTKPAYCRSLAQKPDYVGEVTPKIICYHYLKIIFWIKVSKQYLFNFENKITDPIPQGLPLRQLLCDCNCACLKCVWMNEVWIAPGQRLYSLVPLAFAILTGGLPYLKLHHRAPLSIARACPCLMIAQFRPREVQPAHIDSNSKQHSYVSTRALQQLLGHQP